jgi:hypothetical protein
MATSHIRFFNGVFGQTATIYLNENSPFDLPYGQASPYISVLSCVQHIYMDFTDSSYFEDYIYASNCQSYTWFIYKFDTNDYRIIAFTDKTSCCGAPYVRFINNISDTTSGVTLLADTHPIFTGVVLLDTGRPVFAKSKPCLFKIQVVDTTTPTTIYVPDTLVKIDKKTIYTLIATAKPDNAAEYELVVLASPCRK